MRRTQLQYISSRLLQIVYQKLKPDAPWLVRRALPAIEAALTPDAVGIEWGSGRSSAWFAKRVTHLTSVEDDPVWYENVRAALLRKGLLKRVYLLFVSHEDGLAYVNVTNRFQPESLDFALVDGSRERGACTQAVIPLLKKGGLLIIDNAERYIPHSSCLHLKQYMSAGELGSDLWPRLWELLMSWENKWFNDGVSATALFTKPTLSDLC